MKKLITLALFSVVYQFAFAITIYLGLGGAEFFGGNLSYPEMNNPEHMNTFLNVINSLIVSLSVSSLDISSRRYSVNQE